MEDLLALIVAIGLLVLLLIPFLPVCVDWEPKEIAIDEYRWTVASSPEKGVKVDDNKQIISYSNSSVTVTLTPLTDVKLGKWVHTDANLCGSIGTAQLLFFPPMGPVPSPLVRLGAFRLANPFPILTSPRTLT